MGGRTHVFGGIFDMVRPYRWDGDRPSPFPPATPERTPGQASRGTRLPGGERVFLISFDTLVFVDLADHFEDGDEGEPRITTEEGVFVGIAEDDGQVM